MADTINTMNDLENLVKLAVDAHKGCVEKYSAKDSQETLRKALIEANGGSTVLNYRAIRDGKCPGLFTLIEEILDKTTMDGLQGNEFFNTFVEYRNVAEGDKNVFVLPDTTLFTVDESADGTQAIRRQRLSGSEEISIPTTLKTVRIYEELNRVLSGRVDFNEMINKVAQSFQKKIMDDIFTVWSNLTAANFRDAAYFSTVGSYNEDALLDLIAHVEAAAGSGQAIILGTKKALRRLNPSNISDLAKDDLYNTGYMGKFFGTPVVAIPQRHAVGSTNFLMNDDVLTIVVGDAGKPIKLVKEGNPIMFMRDPSENMDLTQEYFYGEKYGIGFVFAGNENTGIGHYEIA